MRSASSSLAVLAFATALLVGCGGSDDGANGGAGRDGGSITIAQGAQPDSLDPAVAYTGNSWEPLWLVYTAPLTYRRAEGEAGAELIPGAAEALPQVSADGRTYTFTIRSGLRYSDGTRVEASDFEHAVKRVLNLESGGTYLFEGIVGAGDYIEAGDPDGDIAGISANDRSGEVTVELEQPDATFEYVLATTFAGLVPSDTPFRVLNEDPPAGIGPYAITKSVPNREFVMERVDGFDLPGIPKGNVDVITTEIVTSPTRAAQDVIDGRLDYMQDAPPVDLMPEINARYADRYKEWSILSNYYFFLNQSQPPFDDERVRQAVNHALDSSAIARLFGGRLAPSCSVVPAGIPGHYDGECPYGDPAAPGDLEQARRLVGEAGAEGEDVTVYVNSDTNRPEIAQYYTDLLDRIGLDAELRVINGAVYMQTIGNEDTAAQTGLAIWYADFPHPATFVQQFDGRTIQPRNNSNYGYVDDPQVNARIDELLAEPDLEQAADGWAELDRRIVEQAYAAPFGSEELSTFMSERMDFENCSLVHPLYGNDYSSFCLK